jgi:hypothetical protein
MTAGNTILPLREISLVRGILCRNKIGLSLLSQEGSTTQLGGKKKELEFRIFFFLVFLYGQPLIILLALGPHDEPLQSIALPFAY